MATYQVEIERQYFCIISVEVEANSEEEAGKVALENCSDGTFGSLKPLDNDQVVGVEEKQ